LERLGFVQVRQQGSHVILKKQTPAERSAASYPYTLNWPIGTLQGILHQAGVTPDDFVKAL
jgi:predicted RNA binding protein YcfA (HicA-like mRNA interferase family)